MENLDLFKINFQFNFRNNENFSTIFSQILSIVFILICLIIFLLNFIKLPQREGLSIISYRKDSSDEKVPFNESNLFFGFSLVYTNYTIIPDTLLKYFTINASTIFYNVTDNNITETKLELTNCNQTLNKYFLNNQNLPINSCIDFNNSFAKGNIYSTMDSSNYFSLNVIFNYDAYLKDNNSIKDLNISLLAFFPISSINLNNFTNPYNIKIGTNIFSLNLNQTKTICVPYEIDEIHTDNNYIGTSDNIHQIVSSKYIFHNYDEINCTLKLYIYLDTTKNVYYRRYFKFQDVLNNVNSNVSIIFALFKFLASFFNKIKLRQNLIEEDMLFKIDLKENLNNNNINKDDFSISEEKINEECESSNEIIKLNEINQSKQNFEKLDLTDYSPTLINLLSCKCKSKKKISNEFMTKIIYEYYDSLIDVTNVLMILNKVKNSIKPCISSNKNVLDKKLLLKISRKISMNDKIYGIKTFKIQRNKLKSYNK